MERENLQNAAEALKIKEQVEVLTKGASMEPLLREHRDIAQISRAKPPFEKGDIVLYTRDNQNYILHRIVKIGKEGFVIRGDNNSFYERDIREEDIIGILTAVYRKGRYMPKESAKFKMFGILNKVRFPFMIVCRKARQLIKKMLKAKV